MKMQKIFASLLVLGVVSGAAVFADDAAKTQCANNTTQAQRASDDWTFFQIGFWFDVPSYTKNSNVYGIKTGEPVSSGSGNVCGLEASWIAAATDNINGAQGSWVSCFNKKIDGVQASLGFCRNTEYVRGAQASFVCLAGDVHGLQTSAVNVSGNVIGCQPAAILNHSKNMNGVQLAVITNVSDKVTGFQSSLVNSATDVNGMQFGLINMSKGKSLQFGLLNYIDNAAVPLLPLVNFKF